MAGLFKPAPDKTRGMNKKAVFVLFQDRPSPRQNLFVRVMEKTGYEVGFIAWNRKGDGDPDATAFEGRNVAWVSVKAPTWSAKLAFFLFAYYRGVLMAFKSGVERPDVVFITHLAILPLAPFMRGAKKIYDSAELHAFGMAQYFGPFSGVARRTLEFLENALVKGVDGVTVVDSKDGALERRLARWNGNVQLIWNTPDIADDPDMAEVSALKMDVYDGRKVVAFVGGLMKEKGLRVALKSAGTVKKTHPDALFVFIGPMKDDAREIEKLVESEETGANIRFMDFMPYRRLLAHLACAKVGLALFQPVMHYGQISSGGPRRYFTYMQAGIPVIGPDFGEAGAIVKETDCGILVNASDPSAVAGAVIRLLDDPQEAGRLGSNGRKAFESRFNWSFEEAKLTRLINC